MEETTPFLNQLTETADGSWTLRHPEHGETFHSFGGALREAEELYIKASGVAERIGRVSCHVLDVGLGLGYNALATIAAYERSPKAAPLKITSLECDGRLVAAVRSGTAPWMNGWPAPWRAWAKHPPVPWVIHTGDARADLSALPQGPFDFIWQDPFSPRHNPTLWDEAWFTALHRRAHRDTVLMTYSVARPVRDALKKSGWTVNRIPAIGPAKRQWLRATIAP